MFLKKTNPHDDLGIVLKGGNAVGIFVHNIQASSLASGQQGLRCGDQILEVSTFCHPQRSWGKVIFSQMSVILLTGGGLVPGGGACSGGACSWGGLLLVYFFFLKKEYFYVKPFP